MYCVCMRVYVYVSGRVWYISGRRENKYHAVECNEGTFQNSSLLYTGQPEVSTCIMCTRAVIMTSC